MPTKKGLSSLAKEKHWRKILTLDEEALRDYDETKTGGTVEPALNSGGSGGKDGKKGGKGDKKGEKKPKTKRKRAKAKPKSLPQLGHGRSGRPSAARRAQIARENQPVDPASLPPAVPLTPVVSRAGAVPSHRGAAPPDPPAPELVFVILG